MGSVSLIAGQEATASYSRGYIISLPRELTLVPPHPPHFRYQVARWEQGKAGTRAIEFKGAGGRACPKRPASLAWEKKGLVER